MCRISLEHSKHIVIEKGKKALHLVLNHTLCSYFRSALLWHRLLPLTLLSMGFKLNPHDLYVANSIMNEKQYAMSYYVDDTKVSHAMKTVVVNMFDKLQEKFRKMKVKIGEEYNF